MFTENCFPAMSIAEVRYPNHHTSLVANRSNSSQAQSDVNGSGGIMNRVTRADADRRVDIHMGIDFLTLFRLLVRVPEWKFRIIAKM